MLLVRRWSLPFGALALLIGLNSALMSIFHDTYHLLPAVLAGGLLADVLLCWLRPSVGRHPQLRLFAFAVPAAFYGLYFATLWFDERDRVDHPPVDGHNCPCRSGGPIHQLPGRVAV